VRRTANVAINSLILLTGCVLSMPLSAASGTASPEDKSLPQAIIAYGLFRSDYLALDRLFASDDKGTVLQHLKTLDSSLKALDCDVAMRLAGPHRALILPPVPVNAWFGFPRPRGRRSLDAGWLFVTEPVRVNSGRVLVVLSSAAPEHTTVFWLEKTNVGYSTKLLYDSFKKNKVNNETTVIGAVTEMKIDKDKNILLKDWGEPGVGPSQFLRWGRVFRLDTSQDTVSLVSPGTR
jgi:hypothetical protein